MSINCEKCEKDDAVVIIDTKIDWRKYKCLNCDFEWETKPSEEERREFQ